jgi:hypothetical protein
MFSWLCDAAGDVEFLLVLALASTVNRGRCLRSFSMSNVTFAPLSVIRINLHAFEQPYSAVQLAHSSVITCINALKFEKLEVALPLLLTNTSLWPRSYQLQAAAKNLWAFTCAATVKVGHETNRTYSSLWLASDDATFAQGKALSIILNARAVWGSMLCTYTIITLQRMMEQQAVRCKLLSDWYFLAPNAASTSIDVLPSCTLQPCATT